MSRFKKAALSCVLVLLFLILSCSTAFAIQVGQVTILGTKGMLWNFSNGGGWYDAVVNNQTDYISYAYQIPDALGSPVATYSFCSFSGHNYGTLKLTYDAEFGNIVFDEFNGLYNEKEEKIASFEVINNAYVLEYTGYIPYEFSVRGYFTCDSQDVIQGYTILNISFTPSYDNVTDKITDNQDKNTQAIIENQQQLQENEKIEAGNTGNASTSDLTNAIPNDSEGFLAALESFVQTMTTTDTDCVFNIPALKLPAVSNIIPGFVLWEATTFDMSTVIKLLPIAILSLVQALTTIALVIYCFKELYDIIEYALTLRKNKGGAN